MPLVPKIKLKKNHTFYLSILQVNTLRLHAEVNKMSLAAMVEEAIVHYITGHGSGKYEDRDMAWLEHRAGELYEMALRPGTEEHDEYMEIALAVQERLRGMGM